MCLRTCMCVYVYMVCMYICECGASLVLCEWKGEQHTMHVLTRPSLRARASPNRLATGGKCGRYAHAERGGRVSSPVPASVNECLGVLSESVVVCCADLDPSQSIAINPLGSWVATTNFLFVGIFCGLKNWLRFPLRENARLCRFSRCSAALFASPEEIQQTTAHRKPPSSSCTASLFLSAFWCTIRTSLPLVHYAPLPEVQQNWTWPLLHRLW
jgi:hypothetical protein